MKIILVAMNGKYNHTALGVYSLKVAAEAKGFSVEIKEWTLKSSIQEIVTDLVTLQPDILGFSVYIWNIERIREITVQIRKIFPQVTIVWGGPEVTGRGVALLQTYKEINYLLLGEGEATFPQFLSAIEKGEDCRIPGVAGRGEKGIWYLPQTEKIDMALLPSPYQQMAQWPEFAQLDLTHRIIYYESSRGCPFHCSFCFSGGDKPRYRPMEQVKKDLLYLMSLGVKQVKFVDRTFNFPPQRAYELVQFLLDHYRPGINFHMEIAPNLLDDSFLSLLKKSPCGYLQMEAGIQTLYPPALKSMNRVMNWEKVRKSLQTIMEMDNCHVHLDLIAGLPKESFSEFAHSFNGVYGLFPHQIQLGFLKVLPGSHLDKEKEKWGLVYQSQAPYEIISTPEITQEELDKLRKIDKTVECFFNSNRFRETFRYLLHKIKAHNPFQFFYEFSQFLPDSQKDWQQMPQRSYLLYDFLCQKYPADKELWKDLLAIDWILYGKGERIPGYLSEKKVNYPWPKNVQEKVKSVWSDYTTTNRQGCFLLRLQHQPVWDNTGIVTMKERPSYLFFHKNHTWGVLEKAGYLDVSDCFEKTAML